MIPGIDFSQVASSGLAESDHLMKLFLRMSLATVLGACVAYRFWRRFMPFTFAPSLQGAQSQTLIAAAGALMVVVIGDNVARAFGLVGLGAFIRFRSGISDPRDAAVMFIMIGIGMACGLGLGWMAAGATLYICSLLAIFDATAKLRAKRTVVAISAENPLLAWPGIAAIFPRTRVIEMAENRPDLGKDSGKLVLEIDLPGNMDACKIRKLLDTNGVLGITRVALIE